MYLRYAHEERAKTIHPGFADPEGNVEGDRDERAVSQLEDARADRAGYKNYSTFVIV